MLSAPTEIATLQCQTVCFKFVHVWCHSKFIYIYIVCRVYACCKWSSRAAAGCSWFILVLPNHCTEYKSLSVQFHRDFISLSLSLSSLPLNSFFKHLRNSSGWAACQTPQTWTVLFPISQRCINYTDRPTDLSPAISNRHSTHTHTHTVAVSETSHQHSAVAFKRKRWKPSTANCVL